VIDSCHDLGLGHGSRVMQVTGQLNVSSVDDATTGIYNEKFRLRCGGIRQVFK